MARKWSRPPRKEAEPPPRQMYLSEAHSGGPAGFYQWEEEAPSFPSVFDPEARLWAYIRAATSRISRPRDPMTRVRNQEIRHQAEAFMDWLKYQVWQLPTEQEQYQAARAEFAATIHFLERIRIGEGENTITAMDLVTDPTLTLTDLQQILGPLLATKHHYYTDRHSTETIVIAATDIASAYYQSREP